MKMPKPYRTSVQNTRGKIGPHGDVIVAKNPPKVRVKKAETFVKSAGDNRVSQQSIEVAGTVLDFDRKILNERVMPFYERFDGGVPSLGRMKVVGNHKEQLPLGRSGSGIPVLYGGGVFILGSAHNPSGPLRAGDGPVVLLVHRDNVFNPTREIGSIEPVVSVVERVSIAKVRRMQE